MADPFDEPGRGGGHGHALVDQFNIDSQGQYRKQLGHMTEMQKRYEAELAQQDGITTDQLYEISSGAAREFWPHPLLAE